MVQSSRERRHGGRKLHGAAKSADTKKTADQPVSVAEASENKITHAPDNNKRLAFLEGGVDVLTTKLAANGFTLAQGEDPIGVAAKIVDGWGKYQRDGADLHVLLSKYPGFTFGEGETCFAAAARVIAGADEEMQSVMAGSYAAINRADAAEAKLDIVVDYFGSQRGLNIDVAGDVKAQLADYFQGVIADLDQRVADAEENGRLKALEGAPERAEGEPAPERAAYDALVAGAAPSFADVPEGMALSLVFTDGDGLLAVPPVAVSREEITLSGGRAVYDRRLGFDAASPAHRLAAVWLVARDPGEGGSFPYAVRCEVPGGLAIGGGAQAAIPAGHLIF